MKIGIYSNKYKDAEYRLTLDTAAYLKSAGAEVFFCAKMKEDIPKEKYFDINKEKVDALIVFGGDGTILSIAGEAATADIPIFGINLGHMGFLTEVENDKVEDSCKQLLSGKYHIEERSMLITQYNGEKYLALNDIVFFREEGIKTAKKLVRFEIFSNGSAVDTVESDGLIISTPTGSTAYSLSAGGPILSPQIAATLVTAICPHSLHTRPLVLCDSESINIRLNTERGVNVSVDGCNMFNMSQGENLTINKAPVKAKFIRLGDKNFYFKLINKLNKWSTTSV